jgi:phosphoribosyl-ATP pyrophosphohydrolase
MSSRIKRLYEAVEGERSRSPARSKTARLMSLGRDKMAQKLGEEAVEVVICATRGDREQLIPESVDLLYHLVVLWAELGVKPADIWAEMDRREEALGLAEKLPKTMLQVV